MPTFQIGMSAQTTPTKATTMHRTIFTSWAVNGHCEWSLREARRSTYYRRMRTDTTYDAQTVPPKSGRFSRIASVQKGVDLIAMT